MSVEFSIIIPVYNCAMYLENCVSSILAQTVCDYEILLIDDGSKDESGRLCDELAARDSRIRVFHKENGGAASARNYGLDRAAGRYILFIDGDDTIDPDCLMAMREAAADGTMGIFGMSFDYYRNDTVLRRELLSCKYNGNFTPAEISEEFGGFFDDNQLSSACNKIFDRSLIERLRLRFAVGVKLYEDFDFVVRYLTQASSIICIPRPLYFYRLSADRTHLDRRVADLDQLQNDLAQLMRSVLALYHRFPEKSVLSVPANLYLQMLDWHLMQRSKLSPGRLKKELPQYCAEPTFAEILSCGAKLNDAEACLLHRVRSGHFVSICFSCQRRRLKARAKRSIKRIIGR